VSIPALFPSVGPAVRAGGILVEVAQKSVLVYRITKGDGSSYNRKNGVQLNTKSKVGGAISNGEYRSQETKAST
jgi:hypothetical protein